MDSFYIARQPVIDRKNRIFAYEILFRGNRPEDDVDQGTVMSATTINNLINVIGVENVIGLNYGIIKITPLFLERTLIEALPKEHLIFAVFEEDLRDPAFLESLKKYKKLGYTFALNDLHNPQTLEEPYLLELFSYIKLDHEALDEDRIKTIIGNAHKHGIKTICSKIGTRKDQQKLASFGSDYFQGFFFSEPEIMEEYPIRAETGSILLLWNLIRNDASTDELVEAFEREHTITLQLLRFINSPFFSLRQTVTSVRHLITLLGRNQLSQWLLVMLFAKESQKENGNHPLVLMVINRTELMTGLLKLIHPDAEKSKLETAYLVGMLSLIHLIFHRPPREILHHLHVSKEIEEALFEGKNVYGELLNMVRVIENNDITKLDRLVKKHNLSPKAINQLSIEAMKKVNAFDEALRTMTK
ncbi:EAL and HDOD domain-containing protein [Hydrogenimonas cancrithermarum]|uniref:Cyclic diguanylate phosphodiesterase n=1 Tax=Hydrogenimonas cancrithermarum TaxID=2993563 RepID=A0ABN6WT93_9BACT|nr:EAL domain-containing protein [Hydrogenimonas cancrithermarum]BDY12192.1 cyclic diguanylate phosphodiesterase [Hydrogenimonas cancrithermarum]